MQHVFMAPLHTHTHTHTHIHTGCICLTSPLHFPSYLILSSGICIRMLQWSVQLHVVDMRVHVCNVLHMFYKSMYVLK